MRLAADEAGEQGQGLIRSCGGAASQFGFQRRRKAEETAPAILFYVI